MSFNPPEHTFFAFSYILGVILLVVVMFDFSVPVTSPRQVSSPPPSFLALGTIRTFRMTYHFNPRGTVQRGSLDIRYSANEVVIVLPFPLTNIVIPRGGSRDVLGLHITYTADGRLIVDILVLFGAEGSEITVLNVPVRDIRSIDIFTYGNYARIFADTTGGVHMGFAFPNSRGRIQGGEFHEVLDSSGKIVDVVIKGFGLSGSISAGGNFNTFCEILCNALDQAKANGDSAGAAQLGKWSTDNGTGKACNCTGGHYKGPTGGVPPKGRAPVPTPPASDVPLSPQIGPNKF